MSVPSAQPRTQVTPVLHCTVFTSLIRENYSTLRQTRAKIARIVTLFLLHADIAGGIQKVSQQSTTEIETNKSCNRENCKIPPVPTLKSNLSSNEKGEF